MTDNLGKKRKRPTSTKKTKKNNTNIRKLDKKLRKKSRKIGKKKTDNKKEKDEKPNNVEENFLAKLKKNKQVENNQKKINIKIEGDMTIFAKRREKAKAILTQIKESLNIRAKKEIIDEIKKCLKYDNTNIAVLNSCLNIFLQLDLNDEFYELLNLSKFSLTKETINVEKFNKTGASSSANFENNINKLLFNNDKEIILTLISCFQKLKNICIMVNVIKKEQKMKKELKSMLTFNLRKKEDEKCYYIIPKNGRKDITKRLYQEIMNFLKNYIYIKNFDYFVPNQPINLQLNKTLYLFHIFYKFYEYIVDVNIKDEKITITLNMQKMNIFENMKEFVNNIIEELGKSFQKIDEQTEKKINFFFLCFKIEPTENNLKNLQKNIDNMLSQMSQLTPKKIELFLENNKELKSFLSLENESLILKTKAKEYKFNIEVYNDTILTSIKSNIENDRIIDKLNYENIY